eukprot:7609364-Pyramimonas_sp.AAC.1
MGGSVSGAAVAVGLAAEEDQFIQDVDRRASPCFPEGSAEEFQRCVKWIRYVDDALAGSHHYCNGCLRYLFEHMFSGPVSVAFESQKPGATTVFDWLPFEIH